MITDEKLSELRALETMATLGPWECSKSDTIWNSEIKYFIGGAADAAFIVAARNALPELLDAIAARDARIAELEAALRKIRDGNCPIPYEGGTCSGFCYDISRAALRGDR